LLFLCSFASFLMLAVPSAPRREFRNQLALRFIPDFFLISFTRFRSFFRFFFFSPLFYYRPDERFRRLLHFFPFICFFWHTGGRFLVLISALFLYTLAAYRATPRREFSFFWGGGKKRGSVSLLFDRCLGLIIDECRTGGAQRRTGVNFYFFRG
jgi:hypothetical protein